MDMIKQALNLFKIEYVENFDVVEISTIKFSQIIDLAIFPKSVKELICVLKFLQRSKEKYKVVGNTSNLLFVGRVDYPIIFTNKMKCSQVST